SFDVQIFRAPRGVAAGRDDTPAAIEGSPQPLRDPRPDFLDRVVVRGGAAGGAERERGFALLERAAVVAPIAQSPGREHAHPEGAGDGHGSEQAWNGEDHENESGGQRWPKDGERERSPGRCERTPGTAVHTEAGEPKSYTRLG